MRAIFYLLILSILLIAVPSVSQNHDLKIWFNQPAQKWDAEALPIGNGRMGAMLFGGIEKERIQFNEQSLWSGDNNWDGAYETGDHGFGCYRNFGDINLEFKVSGKPENYSRNLDITSGIHTTNFKISGLIFHREAFASQPDQVMVFRYTANMKGALSGKIQISSAQGAESFVEKNILKFSAEMPNKLKYAAGVKVVTEGGKLTAEGDVFVFENCNSLILYVDARTNYKPDYKSDWRGDDPLPAIEKELLAASAKPYKQLMKRHVSDLKRLTLAAHIDIGKTAPDLLALPTDERLKKYSEGGSDPDLEEMIFQYGRYLLASSSRKGGLPANLQGLWNDSNTPPWASDYHNNINIQMNYWAAESTNLSECHLPLIDYIVAQAEPCRIATRKAFGEQTRGWTARTSQSIFGGNGWEWNIPANAWYAQHVYEHWAFTRDNEYLKNTAYPIMKEICQYWEDRLKMLPDGSLVVPMGWSPEHGPREDGVMHDQQLVWDLFQNFLEAAATLGADPEYQKKVAEMMAKLVPNKIGKWGQLQEWQEDLDDPDDQHRHTSHLFAVYPGRQISTTKTPELAKAAIISLRSRSGNYGKNMDKPFTVESTIGDSRRSWTWPWRCALWARLGEGERAGIMVTGLLKYNILPNLYCTHPPFQMDGNFGISGAMAEMLIQSHAGEIDLLPAIPERWSSEGSFSGLCARGGYVVDCSWKSGKVTSFHIKSRLKNPVKVRANGDLKIIIPESLSF